MKMRLWLCTFLCGWAVYAQPGTTIVPVDTVVRAQQEIDKLRDLVAAGAVAPARLQDAEQALGDARDGAILNRTLYGRLTVQDLTEDQTREMVAAADRRLVREIERLARLQKMVDAGVIARGELAPTEQEIESRRLTVDLANSRARLLVEITEMARREQVLEASIPHTSDSPLMEHFDGPGAFSSGDLKAVELAYEKQFKKPLPISANGETAVHQALGFDHRGRVDVAVTPDQAEGVWLRAYLSHKDIPYYAFRAAIPGKATGAHIHIGPASTRLRAAD